MMQAAENSFSWAMAVVLSGGKVRREDWNRPAYIEQQLRGGMPFVAMVMQDGTVGPYSPSHCDMLADDWYAPEGGEWPKP